jgi:hypothetical protein
VSIFSPLVIEGVRSIYNEAWKMCVDTGEVDKYLMTFQNLLSRVPKWNAIIIEEERKRIIERSGCNYLEDLITCVHIIQLKVLTCIRVGNKQKKIDISIPKLDNFLHKVYIHVARKVYMNVYLFEKNVTPLQIQKNNRELETIVQECVLMSIRESIPTEAIIRAYMDESMEEEETVTIEAIEEPVLPEPSKTDEEETPEPKVVEEDVPPPVVPTVQNVDSEKVVTRLTFDDYDTLVDETNKPESVNAPKTVERLEEISASRAIQRKLEEADEDAEERIKIFTDSVDLSALDFLDIDGPQNSVKADENVALFDFEEL